VTDVLLAIFQGVKHERNPKRLRGREEVTAFLEADSEDEFEVTCQEVLEHESLRPSVNDEGDNSSEVEEDW
jgi:hypothetical protein